MEKNKCIIIIEDEAEQALESEMLALADAAIMDTRLPQMNGWHPASIIKKK